MSAGKRKMDLRFSLLYVCCLASILPASSLIDSKTVKDLLMENDKLSQMEKLVTDAGLLSTLGQGAVTLFVPSNDAFDQSLPGVLSTVKSSRSKLIAFVKYHMVLENLSSQSISSKTSTQSAATEIGSPKLYFSSIGTGQNKKYTVNGAVVVTKDIIASNGRIHIINDLLYPIGTTKTSYLYTLSPELPDIAFLNSIPGFHLMPDIVGIANSTKEVVTVFSTNDTKLYQMSDYAAAPFYTPGFLKEVTKGHMVRGSANFIPKLKDLGSVKALNGTIKFIQSGKDVYVSNRGAQAKVLVANIPLANGVMHVIDDLMFYVYKTILEELISREEFSATLNWVNRVPSVKRFKELLGGTTPITMFVPMTSVVQSVPESDRHALWYSTDKLIELLNSHMIIGKKLTSDSITDGLKIVNSKGQTFKFYKQQDGLYVEVGYIRARIIRADVGCKNGVIHLIDKVLKLRLYNLHDLINHEPDLKSFATLVGQDKSTTNFLQQSGDKTVFAPSDKAMKEIGATRLGQIGQNAEVLYQVLKSHIIPRLFLDAEALSKIKSHINDSFGEALKVSSEGDVINVSLADGTIGARVIRKNLVAKNGMLHIIDKIIYRGPGDIYEYIQKDPLLSCFKNLAINSKESENLMKNSVQLTMFIPENSGFDEVTNKKLLMLSNRTGEVIKQHTVWGERIEKANMTAGLDVPNMVNEKIYFGTDGTDILVIGGYIRARIVRTKRCLNGIIYTIDKLLYYVPFNVWELIQKHPLLNKFRDFVDGEYLRDLFTTEANKFTVFAPSDDALKSLDKLVTNADARLPPQVLKIIESHIIKGKMITSDLMRKTYKNPALNGDIISLNKTTSRHVYVKLELQDTRATVVERDVIASNGVIHVIDKLLVAQPTTPKPGQKITSGACSVICCHVQKLIFMGIILHILRLTT